MLEKTLGAGSHPLPDLWRQLEQHFQCRFGRAELEQRAFELEQQHRVSPRYRSLSECQAVMAAWTVHEQKGGRFRLNGLREYIQAGAASRLVRTWLRPLLVNRK